MSLYSFCIAFLLFISVSAFHENEEEQVQLVFNGEKMKPLQNKHLVLLRIRDENKGGICSGSIIEDRWILSAAHCFESANSSVNIMSTVLGKLGKIGDGEKVIRSSQYDMDSYSLRNAQHDVALVKTKKPIVYSKYVKNIRLATRSIEIGKSALVAGYGDSEFKNEPRQGVVVLRNCTSTAHTSLLCSQSKVTVGAGDSGGPLTSGGKLVGISSMYSIDPATRVREAYYVDVFTYIDWIQYVIKHY